MTCSSALRSAKRKNKTVKPAGLDHQQASGRVTTGAALPSSISHLEGLRMERIYEKASETAKKVRKALKEKFPTVKFSVRSETYSGGSSISVYWTDGPLTEDVEAVTDRFKSSTFDGMQDMKITTGYIYEGKLYKGADFIFCERRLSPEYRTKLEEKAAEMFPDFNKNSYRYHEWINKAEKELLGLNKRQEVDFEFEPQPIPEQKTEMTNQKPSNVIDFAEKFAEKKVKSWNESLTPEQRLKLSVITQLLGREKATESLMKLDFNVDELFRICAIVAHEKAK